MDFGVANRHEAMARAEQVAEERRAIIETIGALPEGTLVVHGAARGADSLAASEAQRNKLPTASVPYFSYLGRRGGHARNAAMIAMITGLKDVGWKVKTLGFAADSLEDDLGGRKLTVRSPGSTGCMEASREAGLFVKVTFPMPEPTEEPEDSEPTMDEDPAAVDMAAVQEAIDADGADLEPVAD